MLKSIGRLFSDSFGNLTKLGKWLGLSEEIHDSSFKTLRIKIDRIPNPTKEEREVKEIPVKCKDIVAKNSLAWFILRRTIYPWLGMEDRVWTAALLTEKHRLEILPHPMSFNL